MWISNGSRFNDRQDWGNGHTQSDRVGDFNGDGKDDVIQFYNGRSVVRFSTGSGFGNWADWGTGHTSSDKLGDFNGDGKDDVIQFYQGRLVVRFSTSSNFGNWSDWGRQILTEVVPLSHFKIEYPCGVGVKTAIKSLTLPPGFYYKTHNFQVHRMDSGAGYRVWGEGRNLNIELRADTPSCSFGSRNEPWTVIEVSAELVATTDNRLNIPWPSPQVGESYPSTPGPSASLSVAMISINPNVITAGQSADIVVTLNRPAPAGGVTVILDSDSTGSWTVFRSRPTNVGIPAGSTQGRTSAVTERITNDTIRVTFTAHLGNHNGPNAVLEIR